MNKHLLTFKQDVNLIKSKKNSSLLLLKNNYKMIQHKIIFQRIVSLLFMLFLVININSQENKIEIEGVIIDNQEQPLPYVSVHIPTKQIGTTSTNEGKFYLALNTSNLQDTLVFSSMGFNTYSIKIDDYLKQNISSIILEEAVTSLETVEITSASKTKEYVFEAVKQAKNTFLTDNHQLNLLYRRASVEQNVSKFFVEQYMSIIYKGPLSAITRLEVNESRKSADYRIAPQKQWDHAAVYMINLNPMTDFYTPIKKMNWIKIGDTSYDGEDVMIVEGTKEKVDRVGTLTTTLYIGYDTFNIYKIESSAGKCVYQYVKNSDEKLYLSYHKREYIGRKKISEFHQKNLGLNKPQIQSAIRHEAIILGVVTDKKQFTAKGYEEHNKELNEINLPYNPEFWNNLSLPPDTAFYKKIKAELEANYGVPLELQYKAVN